MLSPYNTKTGEVRGTGYACEDESDWLYIRVCRLRDSIGLDFVLQNLSHTRTSVMLMNRGCE
jgi:hypothetical protein